MGMYCFQCEETVNGACTKVGACGKSPDVAALQDLLVWQVQGLAFWAYKARGLDITDPVADRFIAQALFSTITNVSFDPERFAALVLQAIELRESIKARAQMECKARGNHACDGMKATSAANWMPASTATADLVLEGMRVGIMADPTLDTDIRSLRELLMYGLKGLAAYVEHAAILEHNDNALFQFLQDALVQASQPNVTADELTALVFKAGEMGVQAMALLDGANTSTYGDPEPTAVNIGVKEGPAILISGHDLRDLEELLIQTEGKGVNVYTHGEMLPANAYPAFKKYAHFVGNYGNAWWQQQAEFEKFNGAILLTTNCLVKPRASYQDRLFTTGLVGFPDVPHIAERENGSAKDFSAVIECALANGSPEPLEEGSVFTGFAHTAVMNVADQIVEGVKSGAIKRFVVMAGCDGRHTQRSYYTELAQQLPQDNIILTAGCAKYRYNKLELGDIGGIPRVVDAGQCNDSYSLVVIAMKLAEVFGVEDINDLPISYDIAWYEQKAVIVLLALLSLGVKNIRLGPNLPAFISPNVLNVLVENFNIMPIGTVEQDLAAIAVGA